MKPPLKICMLSSFFLPGIGGVEYTVHYLAGALVRLGCQVEVLAPTVPDSKMCYRFARMKRFFGESKKMDGMSAVHELDFRLNLGLLYARFGFDLIHAHLAYHAGYAAVCWGGHKGVPVVVTTHGADVQRIPELSYALSYNADLRKKIEYTLSQADLVTSPSRELLNSSLRLGSPPDKNIRIPNGVDPEIFACSFSGKKKDPYIIFVGRFQKMKGANLLIDAFKRVSDACGNLKLLIVGEGPEKPGLIGQSLSNQLSGKVIFAGKKVGREKNELMSGAQLLVCPSLKEAAPLIILEAMALGLPIVAFDTHGVNELIKDGQNGLLAPKYDTEILAGQIIRLLGDKKLAGRISKKNRSISLKFHWDIIAERYLEAYNRVL